MTIHQINCKHTGIDHSVDIAPGKLAVPAYENINSNINK